MRISSAFAAVLALAACSSEKEAGAPAASAAPETAGELAESEERIDCALRGAGEFARECVVERASQGATLYLVVHHPDGAFRRFEVLKDGRGMAVADGAEEAQTRLSGKLLEVTVGKDRYRFPATQKQHEPTS
jgi:hypothetical protein